MLFAVESPDLKIKIVRYKHKITVCLYFFNQF